MSEHHQQAKSAVRHHSCQLLTSQRTKNRCNQQARFLARYHSHSLSGAPRTSIISRLELQQSITATHRLECQGQASSTGQNCSKAPQPLTNQRAKDGHYQQATIAAKYHNHSQAGEPRTGMISRLELQQGTTSTHQLESQRQASAAATIATMHYSHSHSEGPMIGIISKLDCSDILQPHHKGDYQVMHEKAR